MKNSLFLFVIFCLFGCGVSDLPNNPLDHFVNVKHIKHKSLYDLSKFDILDPIEVVSYNNWYVFNETHNYKGCVVFLSKDFSKSVFGIREGNGPNEVIGSFGIEVIEDSLYLKDSNHHRLLQLTCGDSVSAKLISDTCYAGFTSKAIRFDRFIVPVNFEDSSFMSIVDNKNHVFSGLDFPNDPNLSRLDFIKRHQLYINTYFCLSPSKQNFAWAEAFFPSFGFGKIIGDSIKGLCDLEYEPAHVFIRGNDVYPDDNSKLCVLNAVGTNKYAIFLYIWKPYNSLVFSGNHLLLYYWDGKPFMRLETDLPLGYINYDSNRNILFGIAMNPEPCLVEYDLNGIIN